MASKNSKVIHIVNQEGARLTDLLDTLIVWTEPTNNVDMALSFQESDGCATIWLVHDGHFPPTRMMPDYG